MAYWKKAKTRMISAASARSLCTAQARELYEAYLEKHITAEVLKGRSSIILTDNYYFAYSSGIGPPNGALALWANIDTVCAELRNLGYIVDLKTRTLSPLLGSHITNYRCLHISW